MLRHLTMTQTHDPARGTFMVNEMSVRSANGSIKRARGQDGKMHVISRSASHVDRKNTVSPHPEAYDFIVDR